MPRGRFVLPGTRRSVAFNVFGPEVKSGAEINVTLCLFSLGISIFAVEAAMTLWFGLPSVMDTQAHRATLEAAKGWELNSTRERGRKLFAICAVKGLMQDYPHIRRVC